VIGNLVDYLSGQSELAWLEHADYDAGGALFFRAAAFYAKFHFLLPLTPAHLAA
jgi:hypothetical protein